MALFPVEREGSSAAVKGSGGPSFLIVAGGREERPEALAPLFTGNTTVIAADGGWRLCRDLGATANLVIGDMDTLLPDEIAQASAQGSEIRRYPSDKDQSDLELAVMAAHAMGAHRLTLLGALGGQWDHCLANLLAPLSLCRSLGVWARLLTATAEIYLLGPGRYLVTGQTGTRASLAALSEQAEGLSLQGFAYPLNEARLLRRQTLGLANAVQEPQASISLGHGELLLTLVRESANP